MPRATISEPSLQYAWRLCAITGRGAGLEFIPAPAGLMLASETIPPPVSMQDDSPGEFISGLIRRKIKFHQLDRIGRTKLHQDHAALQFLRNKPHGRADHHELPLAGT